MIKYKMQTINYCDIRRTVICGFVKVNYVRIRCFPLKIFKRKP